MKKIKYLGKKSLVSMLNMAVTIIWYFQLLLFVIILTSSLLKSFGDQRSYIWPVSFVSVTDEDITSSREGISSLEIRIETGDLVFTGENNWKNIGVTFAGILLVFGSSLLIIFQFRKILSSLVHEEPFMTSNLQRIRLIGMIFIAIPLIKYAIGFVYIKYLNAVFEGYEFVNRVELSLIFTGLATLVISEIFRIGIGYREENKLTI